MNKENVATQNLDTLNILSIDDIQELQGKYLTFYTNDQLFGIPIADVVQIIGMQKITKIPEFPDFAKGVINLRGNIIPVIDVRMRFGRAEIPYTERTCIIVTNIHNMDFGFIVDAVDSVANIADENITDPPKISANSTNASYLLGIAKHENNVVLLMNTSMLLTEETINIISNTTIGGNDK